MRTAAGGGLMLPTCTKIRLCQSFGKGQKEDKPTLVINKNYTEMHGQQNIKSALGLAGVTHEIFVKAHPLFLYELTAIF